MSQQLFPFEILEIPAAGAYATLCVTRAANGEVVACKVLKGVLADNAQALTRLRDEARMLSRLDHPSIVKVHDMLNLDGRHVMVMEYLAGMDLERLVRAHPNGLPGPVAAEIIRQAALGLHAAYTSPVGDPPKPLHVIHRDIKPDNLHLSIDGTVKVLDFGTAKGIFDDREAQTVMMVQGSRGYMAPERLDGEEDTFAVDVYALGHTWFQLYTGKAAVVSRHFRKHDEAVAKALTFIPEESLPSASQEQAKALLTRMLAYEPSQRPSWQQVIDDINALLAGIEPDLRAFAAAEVLPAHDQRDRTPPEAHDDYADVSFLGTPGSWETLANPDITEEMSDDAVRGFLGRGGWEGKVPELQLLLTKSGRWTAGPFLEILHAANSPWWQVWQKRPTPAAIATALEFLKQRKQEKSVRAYASEFLEHADERVRKAAKAITEK